MKKLAFILLILLLLVIIFFQYKKYTRLNPGSNYEFKISEKIDPDYHDPVKLQEYYRLSYEIGTFARQQWSNYKIDVLFPDNSSEKSKQATLVYNQMRSSAKSLEQKLIHSAQLKQKGFNNRDIIEIESGMSPEGIMIKRNIQVLPLKIGDKNSSVLECQKRLKQKGFELRIDGIFDQETQRVVSKFQSSNNLYASGEIDFLTLEKLFINN